MLPCPFVSPRSRGANVAAELIGAQRVGLGSYYPFPLGETKPGELIELMKLSAEQKAQLLFRNSARISWYGA
jgi:aminocarboxymuconate-semialdehyde decarboxylase